ncbi:S8 family peptidase [Actinocorallia sp. B10E7]|uniref:S8 family peptidase n=1 Tax=Actinocorallia sp. B10E7 TaxID=3153558 RepID=UPI00325C771D
MRRSSFVLPMAALALAAATALPASAEPAPRIDVQYAPAEIARPGEYLVKVEDGASVDAVLSRARVRQTMSRWSHAPNGFAARLSHRQLELLRSDSRVVQIAQNVIIRNAPAKAEASAVQTDPGWALDRIDQAALPLDGTFTANSTGAGVNVYIIDDGIDTSHPDFGGRASTVYDPHGGNLTDECLAHGTGVAGVVGGERYGVAKQANLLSVRLNACGSGLTVDRFINAVSWVADNHQKPAVANISSNFISDPWFNAVFSGWIRMAVNGLSDQGVFVAASAGNSDVDACTQSPADALGAFAVGATDSTDTRAPFSNWGTCVEIYAPGSNVDIPKAGGGYRTWGGTSFAAPYVAGVAALYKATYGDAPSTTIGTWLTDNATPGVVNGNNTPGPTPNLLLNTGGL